MDTDFWSDADVISVYTRAQAVEDGVLVLTSQLVPDEDLAQQAGFKNISVALTASVAAMVTPPERSLDDLKGRLWDVLWLAGLTARRNPDADRASFVVRIGRRNVQLVVALSGGDDGEPVVTIMQPGED